MNNNPKCSTCKHWSPATEDEWGSEVRANKMGLRKCDTVIMFENAYQWKGCLDVDVDDGTGLEFCPEYANMTAFVQDGSSYSADLYTKATHFCSMHEALNDSSSDL